MAWIESNQELGRHPKMKRFARLLSISWPEAVGYLHYLWWWALDFAQDGDLSQYEAGDIADAVHWKGDSEKFVNALLDAGFLDMSSEGNWEIHDWYDYAGKLLEHRAAQSEYKKRQYSLYSDLRLTRAVKKRDGDICQYCGKTVNWKDRRGPNGGTYSQICPYGRNTVENGRSTVDSGGFDLDNTVVACRSCAEKKGDMTLEEAGMSLIKGRSKTPNPNKDNDRQVYGRNTVEKPTITVPYRTVPNSTLNNNKSSPAVPYEKIKELFNTTCEGISKITGINGKRKKLVAARWKEHPSLDFFKDYFEKVEATDFLKGVNDRGWKANFDWLMNVANMDKVREGRYDGNKGNGKPPRPTRPTKDAGFGLSEGFKMATEEEE